MSQSRSLSKLPNYLTSDILSFLSEKEFVLALKVSKQWLIEGMDKKAWSHLVEKKLYLYFKRLNERLKDIRPYQYLKYRDLVAFTLVCRDARRRLAYFHPSYIDQETHFNFVQIVEGQLHIFLDGHKKTASFVKAHHPLLLFKFNSQFKNFFKGIWCTDENDKKVLLKKLFRKHAESLSRNGHIDNYILDNYLVLSGICLSIVSLSFFIYLSNPWEPKELHFSVLLGTIIDIYVNFEISYLFLLLKRSMNELGINSMTTSFLNLFKNSLRSSLLSKIFESSFLRVVETLIPNAVEFVDAQMEHLIKSSTLEIAENYKEMHYHGGQHFIDINQQESFIEDNLLIDINDTSPLSNSPCATSYSSSSNFSTYIVKFGLFAKDKCVQVTQDWLLAKDSRKLKQA